MILRAEQPEATFAEVLGVLGQSESLDDRLDAVLDAAGEAGGVSARYLYLTAADGRHLHLARSRPVPPPVDAPEAGWGRPAVVAPAVASDPSTEASASGPPLELPVERATEERTMPTPAGRMHAVPLTLGDELVGMVLLGPLGDRGDLGGRARKRLCAMVPALAALARQAHREHLLREEVAALSSREEVGRRLSGSTLELDRFVSLLLDLALRSTSTAAGFVAVVDPDTGRLELRAKAGLPEGFEEPDLSPASGVFEWEPARHGGALGLRDLDWAAANRIGSILAVPLQEADRPLGVFALLNFSGGGTFAEGNLELLETYAEQVRLMLDNARVFADYSRRYLDALRGLACSLDARRPHASHHHRNVEQVARSLAGHLGAGKAEIETIGTAAAIHDVGLLAITETEVFTADQDHPLIGAGMVEHLPLDPSLAEAIATHHEWYDGWGFPRGLRGEAIGRPGRIVAAAEFLVEVVDGAATLGEVDSDRLIADVELRRGSQLDPQAANAAVDLLRQGRLPLEPLNEHPQEGS